MDRITITFVESGKVGVAFSRVTYPITTSLTLSLSHTQKFDPQDTREITALLDE